MKRYGVAARLAEAGIESLEDRIAPAVFLVTNLADAGAGSLRAAIDGIAGVGGANDSIGADTILFKTGLAGTIHLSSEIPILSSLTIGGNGHVQISGDSVTRILDINAGLIDITVSLQNLTFKDAGSTSYGGAIYSTEDLTISHCKFIGNHTTSYGGAIRQSAGVLKISGSTFLDNSSDSIAGSAAVDTSASLTVIRNSVFKGNHTGAGLGGAIWTGSAETKIIGSKIVSNNAEAGGGGIYLYSGNMILKSSVVAHNSTGSDKGGGIAVHGNLSVFSSSISENSAAGNGGGIYADIYTNVLVKASVLNKNISTSGRGAGISTAGTLAIYGSRMAGNEAMYDGGAIYSDMNTSMVVKSCTFSGNRTTNANGGGIATFGNLEVLSSVFTQNSAPGGIHAGGAIMSEFGATGGVSILDSVFRSNYAGSQGGAVCFFNAETNFISGSRIVLNSVLGEGGGLRLINGTTTVTDTVISGNHADHAGGVSIIEAGGTNISRFINCVISGNSANVGGGGMAEGATTNPILQNTVVSGNTAPTNPDLDGTFTIL